MEQITQLFDLAAFKYSLDIIFQSLAFIIYEVLIFMVFVVVVFIILFFISSVIELHVFNCVVLFSTLSR